MSEALFVVAHPDDAEVLFGHAIQQEPHPRVVVASNGEASTVDLSGEERVVARGGRQDESIHGLKSLGVERSQQHYVELADGKLPTQEQALARYVLQLAETIDIARVYSFDSGGFDGHPDHIAAYYAARTAAGELDINHYVRSNNTDAETMFDGNPAVKLRAMGFHASQFALDDPAFWHEFGVYSDQFSREYYELNANNDLVVPRAALTAEGAP